MIKKRLFASISLMAISLCAMCQTLIETPEQAADSINKVYKFVEHEAEFPGGFKAWITYLKANLTNDAQTKYGAPDGMYRVMIQFIVDTGGTATGIKQLTNVGYGMEEQAVRIIRKGPKWMPAIRYGRKVNSIKQQAFSFVIKATP